MKPLIGITSEEILNHNDPWAAYFYGQKLTYSDAIVAAGGIPVVIPLMPEDALKNLYNRLDGILFTGGDDINPELYGEECHPLTINISDKRDQVELSLLAWGLADNKPLFAICRGFQLLNIRLGGNLYQDIPSQLADASNHKLSSHNKDYTYIAHHLKIAPQSQLAAITGSTVMKANTHHHQAIKNVASDLRATAWSEDGIVEGLEHPAKLFALGVQCHPESLYTIDEKWADVFKAFIEASSKPLIPTRLFKFKKRVKRFATSKEKRAL